MKSLFGWMFRIRDNDLTPVPVLESEKLAATVRNRTAQKRAVVAAVTERRHDPQTYDLARFFSELRLETRDD